MAAAVGDSPQKPETPEKWKSESPQKEKPKRAKSAYALFCDEERQNAMEAVRARNSGRVLLPELGKELSQRWAVADQATRERCQQLADQDKQRLATAMREHLEATNPAGAYAAKCAHLIPKRPMSAYFLFIQDKEQRAKAEEELTAEGVQVSSTTMGSKLGKMWQAAEAELKATFTAQAAKAAAEYAEKKKEWRSTSEFSRLEELKKSNKENERKRKASTQDEASSSTDKPVTPRKVRPRILTTLDIDSAVLVEAQSLDLEAPLLALANCKEVQEQGICARTRRGAEKLLTVLKQSRGSVDLDALLAM